MMDNFREESVCPRNSLLNDILYLLSWVIIVVFGMLAVTLLYGTVLAFNFNIPAIILMLITGGIAVLLFMRKDYLKPEYEYTFTNGELDLAMVLRRVRRKELGSMRIKNVEACGHVAHDSFQRYLSMPGIKKSNWFANRSGNLFYFYFSKDDKKRLIIIEPSETMVDLIRQYCAQGAYQG